MSLQVWLPLNGDLHNQGTSNYTISTFRGTETYDNNGKIGKCFYAHGTNALKILNILPDIYNYSAYSLCAWCYIEAQNTFHSGSGIISGGNWNNQVLNLAMSDWSSDHYTKLRISGSNWSRTYNYNFYKNTWYHIVVCDDGTHTYGYVNGVLIGDTAASFLPTSIEGTDICIGGATYYSGMQFFGKINDVRIYDHCLSAAEVREIAQGLVLHYKLDSIGPDFGNPNLLVDGMIPTAAGNGATGIVRSIEDGIQKVVADNPNSNWCTFGNHNTTLALTKGDTFTFSLMIRSPDSTKKPTVYFQSGLGYYGMQGTMSNDWSIIYYTGTWSIDNLQTNLHLGFSSAPGTYYIKYFKLEKGDSVTPWAPKTGEPLSNLNYVEDNSGYNHNGTITGTITVENNSPRYSISSYFNGSSYILTPAGSFAWNNLTQLTFAAWMKPTASMTGWRGSVGIAADTSQVARGIAITDYGNEFRGTYTNGSTYVTVATGKTLTQNEWHYCAGTLNGTEFKLYFDGELVKTQTIDWGTATLNTGARFEVGVDLPGSDEKFTGNYSDIRCYCTALTADDILQLYHTSAKVDNKQNFHTFELVENNSVIKINKRGQTLCNELEENTAIKFYKTNQIIETNEIIEL